VAPALVPDALAREVSALPADRQLRALGSLGVYHASAGEIPAVLQEIGRLREATFRAAGAGSGRPIDLDRFDRHYEHLFVWDHARRLVVGAYRLGRTDALTRHRGTRGLYTRSLFGYGPEFLRQLGPALELGRSFVRVEYQRDYGALLLLWQGIGRFVARHARYRRLFGAVSISAAYGDASRDLLSALLNDPSRRSPLARFVSARRPYRPQTLPDASSLAASQSAIHAAISELERDGKGIPVLLRQYLRLNAEVLSMSVDPAFSNVIDALVVVDLDRVPAALRDRFLMTQA
jgi:putative hemolysin